MIQITKQTQCVRCWTLESVTDDSGLCEGCKFEILNKLEELKRQ